MAEIEDSSQRVELHLLTLQKDCINRLNNALNLYKLIVNTKPSIVTTNRIAANRSKIIRIFASPCLNQRQR